MLKGEIKRKCEKKDRDNQKKRDRDRKSKVYERLTDRQKKKRSVKG